MDKAKPTSTQTYGMPLELFPDDRLFERMTATCPATEGEKEIRNAALKGYAKKAVPDKELSRFIRPAVQWTEDQPPSSDFLYRFGTASWLASMNEAPFIPSECLSYLTQWFNEPCSVAHLMGATFTSIRILFGADSHELEIPPLDLVGHRELLLVWVKEGVTLTLSEKVSTTRSSQGARSLLGIIGSGAQVRLVRDQSLTSGCTTVEHDRWYLQSGAQLHLTELLTGGAQSWLRKEFKLSRKAAVTYTWLAALKADEQTALTTVQEHEGADSSSQVSIKAALSEQARSFYRGTILMGSEAHRSSADQQQRALMISPLARTCAIPSLEVATCDIQCKHGSAASQWREEELTYLSSRGLGRAQAQRLLLEGFFRGGHDLESNQKVPAEFLNRLQESCIF